MRFADHPDWPLVLATIPTLEAGHRMHDVVLSIAMGCLAHIGQTEVPAAIAGKWSDARVALIVQGVMTVAMKRFDRAMDAMNTWAEIARSVPGFNAAIGVGDLRGAIELAAMHGVNASLAERLVNEALGADRWRKSAGAVN